MRTLVFRTATIAGAIVAAACFQDAPITPTADAPPPDQAILASATSQILKSAEPAGTKSYIINFSGSLPTDLEAQVSTAGGVVTSRFDQIGIAVASSSDPAFAGRAAKIKGALWATEDMEVQWVRPERVIDAENQTLVQVVPTLNVGGKPFVFPAGTAHSVAANPHNNHVFVPLAANNVFPSCLNGCIGVFGAPNEEDHD